MLRPKNTTHRVLIRPLSTVLGPLAADPSPWSRAELALCRVWLGAACRASVASVEASGAGRRCCWKVSAERWSARAAVCSA